MYEQYYGTTTAITISTVLCVSSVCMSVCMDTVRLLPVVSARCLLLLGVVLFLRLTLCHFFVGASAS